MRYLGSCIVCVCCLFIECRRERVPVSVEACLFISVCAGNTCRNLGGLKLR